jgi:predicted dehydrogenase
MTGHVRWGVLGASKFAREHMARAIHLAAGGKLAALATSSAEKAAPFQEINPDLTVHLAYDALLADPEIDAVYIPLPNHLHVEMTRKAIAAGKHVLCEKPMTMQADEFDELIALRDQSGLVVAEAYMIVHHPQWQRAHYLVEDGAIGELQEVRGFFAYNNAADPGNIRNVPGTGGGGIPDIGVYTYGATRYVSGQEPQEILHADVRYENGVDTYAEVIAQFDGFTAHLVNSMRMHPFQEMTFHGSEGVLRLTAPFNPLVYDAARIELHQPGLGLRVERYPGTNHYVNQVEAFNASVLDGQDYPVPLEFSQGTQAMIDMVFAKAGQPV